MHIIGITGGTASGKSTFIDLLKEKCKKLPVNFISQDDYYKDTTLLPHEEINAINFDHPDSLDFDLLETHINQLRQGTAIEKPLYSFELHNRIAETNTITPKKVLIIEGILVLSAPKIEQLCNTTIFIDTPEDIRIKRRIKRDIAERRRTKESVLHQFKTNITPMHHTFIEPIKSTVDYLIDGTKDFSIPAEEIHKLITAITSK